MNKNISNFVSVLVLGTALAAGGPTAMAAAQQGGPGAGAQNPEARRGHRAHRGHHGRRGHMQRVFAQLDLTDAQREAIQTTRRQAREQARSLRESGDREAMRAHFRQTREAIRGILTDAQRARIRELRVEAADRHFERRFTRMSERLELDETQGQQVRGILTHARNQRRAIVEASRLDETDPREALSALREQTQAQLSSVLSDEQMATLSEMREHHRGRRGHRGPRGERGPRGARGGN